MPEFSLSLILKLIDQISSPMVKVGQAFDNAAKRYEQMGSGMRKMGMTLTKSITAPIAGWGAFALYQARNVEEAFLEMEDRFQGTSKELAGLKGQLMGLSMVSPHAPEELMKIGAAGLQIGVARDKLADFSKMMADFGTVSGMSGEEATQALKEFTSVMGVGYADYRHVLDVTTKLGDSMNTTGARVFETSRAIGGLGKMVGMAAPQVEALSAWMNSVGTDTGVQMEQVIKKMFEASKFGRGHDLGIFSQMLFGNAPDAIAKFQAGMKENPAMMVGRFVTAIKKFQDAGGDTFKELELLGLGGMRQLTLITRLAETEGDLTRSLQIANEQWRDGNALTEDAARRYNTFNGQLAMLKHTQAALGDQFGEVLLPALKWLVSELRDFSAGFSHLPQPLKVAAVALLGITAAIGPLLIGIGMLSGGLAALGIAAAPVLAVAAAVAAIGAAIFQLTKYWQTLTAGGFVETMKDLGKWLWSLGDFGSARTASPETPVPGAQRSSHEVTLKLEDPRFRVGAITQREGNARVNVMSPMFGQFAPNY